MSFEFESFNPTFLLKSGNLNTILTNKKRIVTDINYNRKRVSTSDGDFLDLDYSKVGSKKIMLLLHGLEGSSNRQYAKGMVKMFNQNGFDAVVMNFRSCSGEMNLKPTTYHSGKTDDLDFVIESIQAEYEEIVPVGFSLGGNVLVKYLGEKGNNISCKVKKAVAFSVPFQLADSAKELAKRMNWIYMRRFLQSLKSKTRIKINQFPELGISEEQLDQCKSFIDFDDLYTAPVHGFKDAEDYWERCSSKQFIKGISIPTLVVNALDDPFLGEECYPTKEAELNLKFTFLALKYGGHVGFGESFDFSKSLWSERLALRFVMADK